VSTWRWHAERAEALLAEAGGSDLDRARLAAQRAKQHIALAYLLRGDTAPAALVEELRP
jgi:hypothetical protein